MPSKGLRTGALHLDAHKDALVPCCLLQQPHEACWSQAHPAAVAAAVPAAAAALSMATNACLVPRALSLSNTMFIRC